jgi:hypothetical protein
MRRRGFVALACGAGALVVAAVVLADGAQARCFDFPDGRRCSTAGYAVIVSSLACALGAVAALGVLVAALVRRT